MFAVIQKPRFNSEENKCLLKHLFITRHNDTVKEKNTRYGILKINEHNILKFKRRYVK